MFKSTCYGKDIKRNQACIAKNVIPFIECHYKNFLKLKAAKTPTKIAMDIDAMAYDQGKT